MQSLERVRCRTPNLWLGLPRPAGNWRVNTGQRGGEKYPPPSPSCLVLTQAQHDHEKSPPLARPMATQEHGDFVLCCVLCCGVVWCGVVWCGVVWI